MSKPISLEELEKSLLDLPPGLEPTAAGQHHQIDDSTLSQDPFEDFMTDKEKDIVAHLHMAQLRSGGLPASLSDYYYRSMAVKRTGGLGIISGSTGEKQQQKAKNNNNDDIIQSLLYFPAIEPKPNARRVAKAIVTEFRVQGSLGKISKASHHRPRTQFAISVGASSGGSTSLQQGADTDTDGALTAEDLLTHVLMIQEQEERLVSDIEASSEAQEQCHANIAKHVEAIMEIFACSEALSCTLSCKKGQRAVGRVLKAIPVVNACDCLLNILHAIDQVVGTIAEDDDKEEDFINAVIGPMIAVMSQADSEFGVRALEVLSLKASLPWLLQRKTGLLVLGMVLGRLETCKQSENSLESTLEDSCNRLYRQHIESKLVEIFFSSSTDPKQQQQHQKATSVYTWQLLALIAVNVDGDLKRDMVMESRDVIMAVVEEGNQRSIKAMNVFLNALGLDASQLM